MKHTLELSDHQLDTVMAALIEVSMSSDDVVVTDQCADVYNDIQEQLDANND